MANAASGVDFKNELRAGHPKLGLFLNSHSPTIAEQLAHSGYGLASCRHAGHGPMGNERLLQQCSPESANGGTKIARARRGLSRPRRHSSNRLDMGADGVLVPYINTAAEARQAVSCANMADVATRSVYFPQRSMKDKDGLLGYAVQLEQNGIVALQVETCRLHQKHRRNLPPFPGVDILFLGQNESLHVHGRFTKNTNSHTCHLHGRPKLNVCHARIPSSTPAKTRTKSCSGLFSSAPPASANFSTKDSPSSASETIYTTSHASRHLRRRRSSASPKKKANLGLAARHHFFNCRFGAPILVTLALLFESLFCSPHSISVSISTGSPFQQTWMVFPLLHGVHNGLEQREDAQKSLPTA